MEHPDSNTPVELRKATLGWGPLAAVLVTVGVFFLSQFLAGVLIVIYGALRGLDTAGMNALVDSTTSNVVLSVLFACIEVALIYAYMNYKKARPQDVGFGVPDPNAVVKAILGYVFYFATFFAVAIALEQLLPGINFNQEQEIGFDTSTKGVALLPIFVSLVIIPPLTEEFLARGFLYTGLRTRFHFVTSTIITSTIFAAAHLQWGSGAPLLWIAFIDTFILSLVLCYLRETTKSLWAPIGVHAIKNMIAFSVLFLI